MNGRSFILAVVVASASVALGQQSSDPTVQMVNPSQLPPPALQALINAVGDRPILRWEKRIYPSGWIVYAAVYRGRGALAEAEVDADTRGRVLGRFSH